METILPVSEVRQKLSGLLKKLQKNPDNKVVITVNGMPVGELNAPKQKKVRSNVGRALLDLADKMGAPDFNIPSVKSVSEHHDDFL